MKRWLVVALVGMIGAAGSAVAAPRALAGSIPLSTFGSIAYDDTNHHVFVTGGSGTSDIFVLDDATKLVATLSSAAGSGPDGLAISPDGSTLLVALADSAAIARFSTATLSEQDPIVLPDPVGQPKKLAFAGGLLWTSFCGGGGGLASISLTDDSVVAYQGGDFPGCVRVRGGGPGASDLLFAWAPYGEPGGASEFAITAGVPTLVKAAGVAGEGRLPDIAVSNDGKTLYSAQAAPGCVGEYAVADLSSTGGTYTTGDHTTAVAVDTNGRIFAGTNGGGLDMFMPGATDAVWSASPDNGGMWDQGIAVNDVGSRVFVAEGELFSYMTIKVAYPDQTPTALKIAAGSSRIRYGSSTTLKVHASLDGPSPSRGILVQQRPSGGDWKKLASGRMDQSGNFAVKVRPAVNTTYRAVYSGDEYNAARTSDAILIHVAVIVQGRLRNSTGTSGGYHLYPVGAKVRYVAKVVPRHRDSLLFRLQKRTSSGWATKAVGSFNLGSDSTVGVYINPQALHRGDKFRIRAEYRGDRDHAGSQSAWSYFRIT